ncbi:hypothetical protein M3223_10215 [Paenibacillus pasadenensis]|uniref:hypothetical protein n=1 Tax=Paenibacillus pasadenensis TaxID=217090 RepID=UPI00203AFD7C|nr:hypothetical protein [Paenibacillus pasadenensis]MCM3747730.1 hypothetical protein [Paenibacillus pasadenensis]
MELFAALLFLLIYALVIGVLLYRIRKGTYRKLGKENTSLLALVLIQLLIFEGNMYVKAGLGSVLVIVYASGWLLVERGRQRGQP